MRGEGTTDVSVRTIVAEVGADPDAQTDREASTRKKRSASNKSNLRRTLRRPSDKLKRLSETTVLCW